MEQTLGEGTYAVPLADSADEHRREIAARSYDLPRDIDRLHEIVVELCERLNHEISEKGKYPSLLREVLEAQRNRKSGQLSKDPPALFEKLSNARYPEGESLKDAELPAGEEGKPGEAPRSEA